MRAVEVRIVGLAEDGTRAEVINGAVQAAGDRAVHLDRTLAQVPAAMGTDARGGADLSIDLTEHQLLTTDDDSLGTPLLKPGAGHAGARLDAPEVLRRKRGAADSLESGGGAAHGRDRRAGRPWAG